MNTRSYVFSYAFFFFADESREYTLAPRHRRQAMRSVFVVLDSAGRPAGSGVFVGPKRAITPLHVLPPGSGCGSQARSLLLQGLVACWRPTPACRTFK